MKLALVIAVAACGAPPPPAPTSPVTPATQAGPDCGRAGRNVAAVLQLDADHAPAIAAVVERHCRGDAWTPAATACVAAAVDHDAALKCAYKHLTEEQHDLVVRDMKPLLPVMPAEPAAPVDSESQADIAAREDADGLQLLDQRRATEASSKFRDAAARVPQATYFLHLCVSLHTEGKFGEALTACHAVDRLSPDAATRTNAAQLEARIMTDAKAQGLMLQPAH